MSMQYTLNLRFIFSVDKDLLFLLYLLSFINVAKIVIISIRPKKKKKNLSKNNKNMMSTDKFCNLQVVSSRAMARLEAFVPSFTWGMRGGNRIAEDNFVHCIVFVTFAVGECLWWPKVGYLAAAEA